MRSTLLLMVIGQATALSIKHQHSARDPTNWDYHGCWTDQGDRQLGGESYTGDNMTPNSCITFCENKGYEFAGVEYARECFCGHQIRSQSVKKDDSECTMACAGDSGLICGGPDRLNVYKSNAATSVTTNPGPVGSGWTYLSCFEDSVYARTLSVRIDTPTPNNVLSCTTACKDAGYKYAGVEWSSECFCDNEIRHARTGDFNNCDMVCSGNHNEYCGGSQRLNLYEFTPIVSTTTTAISITTSASSSPISVVSTRDASGTTSEYATTTSSSTTMSPSLTTTSTTSPVVITTTTTISTTTTSIVPTVTEFRLRAVTLNTEVNDKFVRWRPDLASDPIMLANSAAIYNNGIFSVEAGTNRLKVGSTHYIVRSGATLYAMSTQPAAQDSFVTCAPPVAFGQALKCAVPGGDVDFNIWRESDILVFIMVYDAGYRSSALTPIDLVTVPLV